MTKQYIAEEYSDTVKAWIDSGNTGVNPLFDTTFKPKSLGIVKLPHPTMKEATLRKFNDGSLFF